MLLFFYVINYLLHKSHAHFSKVVKAVISSSLGTFLYKFYLYPTFFFFSKSGTSRQFLGFLFQ